MRLLAVLLLLPCLATAVELSEASTLQIVMELTARGISSWGCPEEPTQIRATWSPPDEGSPAEYYVWKVEIQGAAPDTTVVVPLPEGTERASMMVAGVDALGRQGRWTHPGWWPLVPPGVTMELAD